MNGHLTIASSSNHRSNIPRILYIHPGPVPPLADPARNSVASLTNFVTGHLVMPVWPGAYDDVQLGTFDMAGLNGFGFTPLPHPDTRTWGGAVRRMRQFIAAGRRIALELGPFDLVVSYGGLATGLAAWRLSRHLGVPLVIKFPGHPFKGFFLTEQRWGAGKAWIAKHVNRFLAEQAQHVHLLYPTQLDDLALRRAPPATVSHGFTPVSQVPYHPDTELPEILLLGYPWHLKGVDILIKAFHLVADWHPEVRLRIVGHCPDRTPFERLAAGNARISLEKAVFSEEAHEILSRCRVYVLASRTEGMGRVLLEAMAAGRPIIASRVDGVPHYIQDGVNGLLFESENVAELAEKLDRLLSDAELRRSLGENGRRIVMEKYSEKEYARKMITMFYQVLGREPPQELGATAG